MSSYSSPTLSQPHWKKLRAPNRQRASTKQPAQGEVQFAAEGRVKLHSWITSRKASCQLRSFTTPVLLTWSPPRRGSLQGNQDLFNQHLIRLDVWPKKQCTALGLGLNFQLCCTPHGVYQRSYLNCPVLQFPPCKHIYLRDITRITPSTAKHSYCSTKGHLRTYIDETL